jgi:hypothetical protein
MHYSRPLNLVWLYSDDASAMLGPVAPGQNAVLQNSQCRLDAASMSMWASGNTLTLNFPLTFKATFGGLKNVYLYAQDTGNGTSNWQTRGSWSVPASANQPPTAVSVSPASGGGTSQLFTFTFADPNGGTDITWTQMIINSTLTGVGGCYVHYNRGVNQFWIYNDGASALVGPVYPGQPGVIQNSQCSLDGAGSSTSGSGNVLTLSISLSFKPSFADTKNTYLAAWDAANATSNWQLGGSWTPR